MECTGISVGNRNRTLEQFIGSEQAKSPLGKLFIALTKETVWSSDYTVFASFGNESFLVIKHPNFLPDDSLVIKSKDRLLTVRHVEDAVRVHLKDSKKAVHLSVSILERKIENINQAFDQIDTDKARAAMINAFPEVATVVNIVTDFKMMSYKDLYSFEVRNDGSRIFVARKIDGEFTGRVARIDCSISLWCQREDGILYNQRYGIFWIALARAFAARELNIPEENLHCDNIIASEETGRFIIEKVFLKKTTLCIPPEELNFVVEFENDLPAKVCKI